MTFLRKHVVSVTTASGATGTVYTGEVVNGHILGVIFAVGTLETPTLTITGASTGIKVLTKASMASGTYYPREAAVDTGLAAIFYEGANAIRVPVPIADEKIKIVTTSGGNNKAGTITFIVG